MSTSAPAIAFTITDAALAQVRTVMSQQTLEADERNLRIFVEGGGCCGGVGFGLAFDRAQPDDAKLERGGLTVVVDAQSAPYVNGATIDWIETPEVTGFKVSAPPMAGGGCGGGACGSEKPSGGGCGSGGGGGGCGSGGGHSHGGGSHDHGGGAHDHAHGDHGHSHDAPAAKGGCCGSEKPSGGGGCC